ncbi:hypothetical protein [Streptomyces huiliensis]|uniref:hypothetical protein n=1 Tax=Streptomyces huiliensis TaxID=2876027 RepID=UPI001CBD40EF|nr:hypothetical protein [Streptomyces huiliensis]MBZ4322028.1 hypothetical protein [Streptomyces huiliensis]
MRRRHITRTWGLPILAGALLATSACGGGGGGKGSSDTVRTQAPPEDAHRKPPAAAEADAKPLDAARLRTRLLTLADLGPGYTEVPDDGKDDADSGATGCGPMERLSARMPALKLAAEAKTSFRYDKTENSGMAVELGSDSPARISAVYKEIYGAFNSCPSFSFMEGTTPTRTTSAKPELPPLGDERFGTLLTLEGANGPVVIKYVAVRKGSVVVNLMGSPALVDKHIGTAVDKMTKD